jgi:folate-dependent phosphoribosylglycinamide formyltransferase PurN
MLKKLQQHWGVNGLQVLLILITFALGGSLCGYVGRKLLGLFIIENKAIWIVLYILLVTLLWPLCVLLISIPLGQFVFFRNYVGKLMRKLTSSPALLQKEKGVAEINGEILANEQKINIAIFASGEGSNAKKIIEYFTSPPTPLLKEKGDPKMDEEKLANDKKVNIALIVSNNSNAGVLQIAKDNNINTLIINKDEFFKGDGYVSTLKNYNIDFIVLAGFLWKVPSSLILSYQKKIINIHPTLLPKYGGKGMYGHFVHEAVIAAKEAESGITIHYVDEIYDHGEIIFQAKCVIDTTDTPETLATKIQALEHTHYPAIIASVLPNQR